MEPYFTQEFKDTVQLEEKADTGGEEAAALREENTWKQIAKKRIKPSADEEFTAVGLPK